MYPDSNPLAVPVPIKPPKRHRIRAIFIGILLLGIGVGAGYFAPKYLLPELEAAQPAAKQSPTPTPSPSPMARVLLESLTVPVPSLAAGYNLSFAAPAVWRTVDTVNDVSLNNWPGYNLNDLLALLRFVPENASRQQLYSDISPGNWLNVTVIDNWLKAADTDISAAKKQAHMAYLRSIGDVKDLGDASQCANIVMDGPSLCVDNKVRPQVISSADGSLKGVAYLNMQTQSVSYDPSVLVEMIGTVSGKTVFVEGFFNLYDARYKELNDLAAKGGDSKEVTDKVLAARDAFGKGNVDKDTLELYDRVTAMVKSISFKKQ